MSHIGGGRKHPDAGVKTSALLLRVRRVISFLGEVTVPCLTKQETLRVDSQGAAHTRLNALQFEGSAVSNKPQTCMRFQGCGGL